MSVETLLPDFTEFEAQFDPTTSSDLGSVALVNETAAELLAEVVTPDTIAMMQQLVSTTNGNGGYEEGD